jgi:hypothetical protein
VVIDHNCTSSCKSNNNTIIAGTRNQFEFLTKNDLSFLCHFTAFISLTLSCKVVFFLYLFPCFWIVSLPENDTFLTQDDLMSQMSDFSLNLSDVDEGSE